MNNSPLEKRMEKLERRLRIYQLSFIGFIAVCGFLALTAFNRKSAPPDVIQAKEFQVVDDQGHILVSLKKNFGAGIVTTFDESGNAACKLTATEGGGGAFQVFNKQGKTVDELGLTDIGSGYLGIYNDNGKFLFRITYTADTKGGWAGLYNHDGTNLLKLYQSTSGGQMSIFDNSEKEMIKTGITANNDGAINIFNHLHNRICTLAGDDTGNGSLNVYNSAGQNLNGVWPK